MHLHAVGDKGAELTRVDLQLMWMYVVEDIA